MPIISVINIKWKKNQERQIPVHLASLKSSVKYLRQYNQF
jgi:hypothetical protein